MDNQHETAVSPREMRKTRDDTSTIMSDQPTEKHEFAPDTTGHYKGCMLNVGEGMDYYTCHQPREATVHQPSAVQAPERVYVWQMANGFAPFLFNPLEIHDNGKPVYEYICADAYEAQAVRIAELESENTALKNVAEANINAGVEMAVRIRELEDALKLVEKESSIAHDAIWHQDVTSASILHDNDRPNSAQSAIWRLHEAARAALKPKEGK